MCVWVWVRVHVHVCMQVRRLSSTHLVHEPNSMNESQIVSQSNFKLVWFNASLSSGGGVLPASIYTFGPY